MSRTLTTEEHDTSRSCTDQQCIDDSVCSEMTQYLEVEVFQYCKHLKRASNTSIDDTFVEKEQNN